MGSASNNDAYPPSGYPRHITKGNPKISGMQSGIQPLQAIEVLSPPGTPALNRNRQKCHAGGTSASYDLPQVRTALEKAFKEHVSSYPHPFWAQY